MLNRREISDLKITGKIVGANIDFKTNKPMLMLEVNELNDFKLLVDEMNGCEKLTIEIKPYREKRSLNANNYAWKIITEIGNVLRASKDEIYLIMLKRYGQSDLVSVLSHIPVSHYFKYYEEAGESKLNGRLFTHYRVYKGSSEYDSREMSIFIDGVVSEAKELGIQTETPDEIARLKALWGE
jgi:hypothetical protein